MESIIMSALFIVVAIIALITCIVRKELAASLMCIPLIALFVGLLIISINEYKYGSYSDLVTKYGMTHSGSEINGTYVKDNLIFHHKSYKEDYEDEHQIEDSGEMNLNLHAKIIDNFMTFKEGSIPLIVNYLKDYADHYETNSEITIMNNHTKIKITYYYRNNSIDYRITVVKEYRYIKDKNDNTIKETNTSYKTKYVEPYLKIKHYNEDYQEFDKELIDLLFDKKINDFVINKYNDVIEYTLN